MLSHLVVPYCLLAGNVFDSAECRDRFGKMMQYGSRALKYYLLQADPKSEWGKGLENFSCKLLH
jgi:hypothetical protein